MKYIDVSYFDLLIAGVCWRKMHFMVDLDTSFKWFLILPNALIILISTHNKPDVIICNVSVRFPLKNVLVETKL